MVFGITFEISNQNKIMKNYHFEFINAKTGEQITTGIFCGKNKKDAKKWASSYKRLTLSNKKNIKII